MSSIWRAVHRAMLLGSSALGHAEIAIWTIDVIVCFLYSLHPPLLLSVNFLVVATAKLEGLRNRCRSQSSCDMEGKTMDAHFLCREEVVLRMRMWCYRQHKHHGQHYQQQQRQLNIISIIIIMRRSARGIEKELL